MSERSSDCWLCHGDGYVEEPNTGVIADCNHPPTPPRSQPRPAWCGYCGGHVGHSTFAHEEETAPADPQIVGMGMLDLVTEVKRVREQRDRAWWTLDRIRRFAAGR